MSKDIGIDSDLILCYIDIRLGGGPPGAISKGENGYEEV
jgi:hypothetical protein